MLLESPDQVTFSFLDVETTGLDPYRGDKICEIAILKTRGGEVLKALETLVNPGREIPPKAAAINRITDDMVSDAPYFRDIAWDVLEFLKGSVIVAHNAPFDLGFLFLELDLLRLTRPNNPVLDTLSVARRYYNFPSNSLGRIAEHLGISTVGEHRAPADVRITKQILEFFLRDLDRKGIRIVSLKDVLKLQGEQFEFEKSDELVLPPAIENALREKGKLRIKYLSAYRDATTTRVIEPLEISVSKNHTYIVAFCHRRKDRCTFRLDRILEVKSVA